MVSGIFIFDFDRFFSDFDQNMMEMMAIMPIHYSTFGQIMGIDGVAPLSTPQLFNFKFFNDNTGGDDCATCVPR